MATSESLILSFLGDPSPQLRCSIVHNLLLLMGSSAAAIDEVYQQLCEHLYRGSSSEKVWQLIAVCLSSFPPNQNPVAFCVNQALAKKEGLLPRQLHLIDKCSLQLSAGLARGPRKILPSRLEIECALDGNSVPLRVRCCDEWVIIKVNSHCAVAEAEQQLDRQLSGLVPPKYFALFECSASNQEHILDPNELVLDVMNRWTSQLRELFVSFSDLPFHISLVSIVFEYFSASALLQLLPNAPDSSQATAHNGSCDWREAIDHATGKTYYYDRKSKMTSWAKPGDNISIPPSLQGWLTGTAESHGYGSGEAGNLTEWREAIDSSSKRTYFYNIVTKKTAWNPPENYFSSSVVPEPFTHFLYKLRPGAKILKARKADCLQLAFKQAVSDVATHRFPSRPADLPYLSAVQLQALEGDHKAAVHAPGCLIPRVKEFVHEDYQGPEESCWLADWETETLAIHQTLAGTSRQAAHRLYLARVHEWEWHDATCWPVEQRQQRELPVHVTLAVNQKGLFLLHPATEAVLARYPFSDLIQWGHTPQAFALSRGTMSGTIAFKTLSAQAIYDLIRAFRG